MRDRITNNRRNFLLSSFALFYLLCFPLIAATSAGSPSPHHIFQWRPFLAPFHAVVLHLPIGFLAGAFVLEVCRYFRPSDELRRATSLFLWLSLLSGIVTAVFGIMRAEGGGYDVHSVALHRNSGLLVLSFTLATAAFNSAAAAKKTAPWTLTYRLFLFATLALVAIAGHLGGNLTHGSNYLVENAPDFLRAFLEEKSATDSSPALRDQKEQFYVEKVRPIFEAKCFRCHGSEKQKGGLRLDLPASALKPAASKKLPIVPGDPIGSQLVRLILLPHTHDDVMPPEGRTPLEPAEIGNIIQWIRDGACFPQPAARTGPPAGN